MIRKTKPTLFRLSHQGSNRDFLLSTDVFLFVDEPERALPGKRHHNRRKLTYPQIYPIFFIFYFVYIQIVTVFIANFLKITQIDANADSSVDNLLISLGEIVCRCPQATSPKGLTIVRQRTPDRVSASP